MNLIGLLVALIIFAVLVWAVRMLIPLLGLPAPIATVIYVVLVLVVVIYLLNMTGLVGTPILGRR